MGNVAAHQKKENKEAVEQEKRQTTDFREGACFPSSFGQRAALQTCGSERAQDIWYPKGGQQPF